MLLTFSSEEEMEHARESRIEVIDSVIRLIKTSVDIYPESGSTSSAIMRK